MLKMRLLYAKAKTKKERTFLIDEAIAMMHCSRKCVIRLLNGSHHYRKHRGRKSSYSPEARKFLVQIWRAEGYICPLYLRSMIENAIQDYKELGYTVPPEVADELKRMSASTMNRILRPYRIQRTPNKRSGSKAALAAQIPAGPGTLQVDTRNVSSFGALSLLRCTGDYDIPRRLDGTLRRQNELC